MDPGYSVDATIDQAIKRLADARRREIEIQTSAFRAGWVAARAAVPPSNPEREMSEPDARVLDDESLVTHYGAALLEYGALDATETGLSPRMAELLAVRDRLRSEIMRRLAAARAAVPPGEK